MSYFPNLAGRKDCDEWIEIELKTASIPLTSGHKNWVRERAKYQIVGEPYSNESYIYLPCLEVPSHIMGKLGTFRFVRFWYYYSVTGGSVPLKIAKALYENPIGREKIRVDGHAGKIPPHDGVTIYHIDNQEGLNLFVKYIKELNKKEE